MQPYFYPIKNNMKTKVESPEPYFDDNLTVHEDSCELTNTFEVKDLLKEAPVTEENLFEEFKTRFRLS
jgi:hypothetical protein